MTEDIILLNSFFAEEAFDKSSFQICLLYIFESKATDTAYRYKFLQGLALIQGQIYNLDYVLFLVSHILSRCHMDVHPILEILQAFGQDFHPYRNLEAMYGNVVVVYKVFGGAKKVLFSLDSYICPFCPALYHAIVLKPLILTANQPIEAFASRMFFTFILIEAKVATCQKK